VRAFFIKKKIKKKITKTKKEESTQKKAHLIKFFSNEAQGSKEHAVGL
jgi:hypothetical protein